MDHPLARSLAGAHVLDHGALCAPRVLHLVASRTRVRGQLCAVPAPLAHPGARVWRGVRTAHDWQVDSLQAARAVHFQILRALCFAFGSGALWRGLARVASRAAQNPPQSPSAHSQLAGRARFHPSRPTPSRISYRAPWSSRVAQRPVVRVGGSPHICVLCQPPTEDRLLCGQLAAHIWPLWPALATLYAEQQAGRSGCLRGPRLSRACWRDHLWAVLPAAWPSPARLGAVAAAHA
mmetsp:Transcript_23341/g.66335  ORF Transcript_23341/g.66335 Transcript_23341/m.66335 type:complete len:236 (-) Transcript_23341:905-1612(-)